jgi:hypothetical protein
MTKKHFIALADTVKEMFNPPPGFVTFTPDQKVEVLTYLADFCQEQSSRFDRDRWIEYVNGGKK